MDYLYGPRDVDSSLYEIVTRVYEDISLEKGSVPHIEEVEEWLFRGVINQISATNGRAHSSDRRYENDSNYRHEVDDLTVRAFVEEYSGTISKDIKKCLDHANVTYIGYIETERGVVEGYVNSPQVSMLKDWRF